MQHEFTHQIIEYLKKEFGAKADFIFENSPLFQYINIKTRSVSKGSKARGSFANLYAIYVLVEDYIQHGFDINGGYEEYEGARYMDLFERQRKLAFGSKLENHALNSRLNEEFKNYFPHLDFVPILRDGRTNRYWITENLLKISDGTLSYNLSRALILVIELYIAAKQQAFRSFMETCRGLKNIAGENSDIISEFVEKLLSPNSDARIFEIVSYAILKYYYHEQIVYFGFNLDTIQPENLKLYKTGRTNANDGGIDFVMQPLGRFFQVTEILDVKKYFLDIDKIEKYPISFVVKTQTDIDVIRQKLKDGAKKQYGVNAIVEKYMNCIDEIINIPVLLEYFQKAQAQGYLGAILDEILTQSKVEFNIDVD